MTLPTFPGWELINEILMDLEDALDANREEASAGEVCYRRNLGRKKGLKQAIVIIRTAVSDLEGI
jgi:hypothetical protein